MKDPLFDGKLNKDVQKISQWKAKLNTFISKIENAEKEEIKRFYNEMDSGELYEIFDTVEKFGHPAEKENIKAIKENYETHTLTHENIALLQDLYKSNAKNFSKKVKNG